MVIITPTKVSTGAVLEVVIIHKIPSPKFLVCFEFPSSDSCCCCCRCRSCPESNSAFSAPEHLPPFHLSLVPPSQVPSSQLNVHDQHEPSILNVLGLFNFLALSLYLVVNLGFFFLVSAPSHSFANLCHYFYSDLFLITATPSKLHLTLPKNQHERIEIPRSPPQYFTYTRAVTNSFACLLQFDGIELLFIAAQPLHQRDQITTYTHRSTQLR